MKSLKQDLCLVDVNVLIAVTDEDHGHHEVASKWVNTPGRERATCPFSEAVLLRHMLNPSMIGMSLGDANDALHRLKKKPGYHILPIAEDCLSLSSKMTRRIFGYRQVTDAYLLGLAIRHNIKLATFDRAILHLAGEYAQHVQLL